MERFIDPHSLTTPCPDPLWLHLMEAVFSVTRSVLRNIGPRPVHCLTDEHDLLAIAIRPQAAYTQKLKSIRLQFARGPPSATVFERMHCFALPIVALCASENNEYLTP